MAESLFGHEGRAELASLGDGQMSGTLAIDDDGRGIGQPPLTGENGEQFVLAIAGNAGDAENLATLQLD